MVLAGARRLVCGSVGLLAVAVWVPPAAAAAQTPVHVAPSRGGASSVFTVAFRAPVDTTSDPYNESYEMSVRGPRGRCASAQSVWTSSGHPIAPGRLVRVSFRAPYRHGRWCAGSYAGTISEVSVNPSSSCEQEPRTQACGESVTLIGTFRLRVRG